MSFPAFLAPSYHASTSGIYSVCMAIQCEINVEKKNLCNLQPLAKRSQHFNATNRSIVVAMYWDMLGVVGSNLKMVKFFMRHLWMLHDVVVIWPGHPTMLRLSMHTSSIFNSQQGGQTRATCCPQQFCDMFCSNVVIVWPKLANAGPTMLRYVVLI